MRDATRCDRLLTSPGTRVSQEAANSPRAGAQAQLCASQAQAGQVEGEYPPHSLLIEDDLHFTTLHVICGNVCR